MRKAFIPFIALFYCQCASHLDGHYEIMSMNGLNDFRIATDSCRIFVEFFERLGSISPAQQRGYEVKSSGPGMVTMEKTDIKDDGKIGTLYDPACIVTLLRDAGLPASGIVAGKYIPKLDRSGKTPFHYIQAIDLKPDDLVLNVTMKLARQSPWWTWLQVLDFMLHALVLPTVESNYYAMVQYKLLNRNKDVLSLWAVNVRAKYRGPLTKLPDEDEIVRLAFEQIESGFKSKMQSLGCSCNNKTLNTSR
jgi:hypothetical protein